MSGSPAAPLASESKTGVNDRNNLLKTGRDSDCFLKKRTVPPPSWTHSSLHSVSWRPCCGTPPNSSDLNESFPLCRVSSPTLSRDPSFPPPQCQTHTRTHTCTRTYTRTHSFRPFVGQIAHYMQVEKPQQLKADSPVSSSQSFLGAGRKDACFLFQCFATWVWK